MNKGQIRDIALLITKGTTPTNTVGGRFRDSGINFVKAESLSSSKFLDRDTFEYIDHETDAILRRSRLEENDLLISIAGHLGKLGVVRSVDLPANTNQAVGIIRLDGSKADVEYLFYYFVQPIVQNYIRRLSSQSVQQNLNLELVGELRFWPRELTEQRKIAAVLSSFDAKIELNNRINAELEAMAKMIYDYWFVQFDFPDEKGKPYKSSGGKMIFNAELKREIPDGWQVRELGDVLETSLGGTPSTKNAEYWEDGTISWLNSGEIANFPVVDSELKVTEKGIRNSATEKLPKGTTLLSITRHLRPTVLAIEACANQSVVGIKEKGEIKYFFIYPYLQNEIPRLMVLRTGAQQPHINKDTVDTSLILIPNEESNVLSSYNSKVRYMYDQIINSAHQNQYLSNLRDWLLPMLMNGQVTVK